MTQFKKDFLWGAAMSNVQAEGAYLEDGKGLNVYDTLEIRKEKGQTVINSTAVAANHYHQYKEDIALFKEMGFKAYRFSVVWSRINPLGIETEPNKAGLDFYEDMIDELHEAGIEPVVSLVHFDMPDYLARTYNGFYSDEVVDFYAMHVRQVAERLKDKVNYWITYNEINCAPMGPELVAGAQKPDNVSEADFFATIVHNTELAHAKAVNIIKELNPNTKVGGMINFPWVYPYTTNPADIEAARIANNYSTFLFFDIMTSGEYPDYYKAFLNNRGLNKERRGMDEIKKASGKLDYLSFSYYSTSCITADPEEDFLKFEDNIVLYNKGRKVKSEYLDETIWGWAINPSGLKFALTTLYQRYHKPLFIVENGMAQVEEPDEKGQINDDARISYYQGHIKAMYEAITQDGVDLIGWLAWSPIDFLSSHKEMRKRYGFIYIDEMKDGVMKRIPKKSFLWYKKVIASDGSDLTNE